METKFNDLTGKSVFVTGGGSGIGAALTEGFVRQGSKVAFIQRSDATSFAEELKEKYGNAPLYIPCDVSDVDALRKAIDQAAEANGDINVLVNNAADDTRHDLNGYSVEDWDRSINVNLRPHFFTAQRVAPGMERAGGGSIINFSSISYVMGNVGYPVYATSKAAITGLTRVLARELGPKNIRVNTLLPGWVLTDRQMDLWATPDLLAGHIQKQCLKEHLEPKDIVDPVLFLASSASKMMTGQALVVDGGVIPTG